MKNERGKHLDRDEMKSVVLHKILTGKKTRRDILWSLKGSKYELKERRGLDYHFSDRNKKGLIDIGILEEANGVLSLKHTWKSLVETLRILFKHPYYGKKYQRKFADWLREAYESDYGDLSEYGIRWEVADEKKEKDWLLVMESTRGEYYLDFAVSYLVSAILSRDLLAQNVKNERRRMYSFSAYNLTLHTKRSIIKEAKHRLSVPVISLIFEEMIIKASDLRMEDEAEDGGYVIDSLVGQFYDVINDLMSIDLREAEKITCRIADEVTREFEREQEEMRQESAKKILLHPKSADQLSYLMAMLTNRDPNVAIEARKRLQRLMKDAKE